MPRLPAWGDWHQELDQVLDECQTIITDASTVMERTERAHGQPKPIRACQRLSAVVQTDRQTQLIWYYDTFGVIGVAHCVYLVALEEIASEEAEEIKYMPKKRPICDKGDTQRKRQKLSDREHADRDTKEDSKELSGTDETIYGHSSWHDIVNDYLRGSESRILFMLASIPSEVLEAILLGNLPRQMQDPLFRDKYGSWLALEDTQGTYAAYVAVNPVNIPDKAGAGLTLEDMLNAIKRMLKYISPELRGSKEIAKNIDNQFDPGKNREIDYTDERKFGCGSDGSKLDRHKTWLQKLLSTYSERAETIRAEKHDGLLEEHLARCMVYCGASGNCLRRGPEHWTLRAGKNSSPMWGLFLSTLKSMFGTKYTASSFTYQILRTVHEGDIGLDEILTSVIHSGYWWDLGTNLTWAGTASSLNCKVGKLSANSVFIRESGHQERSIQESIHKIKSFRTVLEAGRNTERDEFKIRNDIRAKVNAAEEMLKNIRHHQAVADRDALVELFQYFEDASI